jgi:hypothetical protein
MLDQPTVVDGAQRMAELVADTNDDYEGETVPSDPDREAAFAEMVAAAEREIAAEKEEKPFGVVDESYWHDEPAIGAKRRFPTWTGKGAYAAAVTKVKSRSNKGRLVTVNASAAAEAAPLQRQADLRVGAAGRDPAANKSVVPPVWRRSER